MSKKFSILFIVAVVGLAVFFIFSNGEKSGIRELDTSNELIPIDSITHGHGLSVDVSDQNTLYIATHHGLLVLKDEKDLYQVGSSKDDYMGFSPHPNDPKIFFSSGHPASGGNIGFQKSEDGGFKWKKVSNGLDGPVDFHAMAVSPVNPNLIYGWYKGEIQRSNNGGKNWEAFPNNFPVINLAADPKDENVLYAASPQGLFVSKNKGEGWINLLDGFVSTIAINPQDSQELISYSEKQQLAKSSDGGQTWEKISADFSGETPLFISFSRPSPETIYFLTEKNSLYKSADNGITWRKTR